MSASLQLCEGIKSLDCEELVKCLKSNGFSDSICQIMKGNDFILVACYDL